MPKISDGKKYVKGYSEEDLENALRDIKNGMGKKTAAKKYNIPRATLQFRLSNAFVKNRPGPDTVLTSAEESELVKWIIASCKKGFPRRKEDIIMSVKKFLDDHPRPNCFVENTPGEGWYKLFLKRKPELSIRTSETVTSASAKVSEAQIRKWFKQIEEYLKENDLFDILSDPSRVYNGDETNFILCPKNNKVIALKGTKNVYEIDHAQSKSCVTVMFTFGADGETTPPMIIFPLKRMRLEVQKSVPDDWGIGLSDNGWMKAELFIQYIENVLYPALKKRNVPIILFLDGHKSHTTLQLTQLCQRFEIILIALYPNATRILQPADVAAFRPIKVMWRKAVLEWRTENLSKSLLKTDVGPILAKLLPKINKTTIKNGFAACGLCPFNPNLVDYSKCLLPSKSDQDILDETLTRNLNFQAFNEIVGPQLMRKMKNQIVGKSVEAKKLFELYKYLTSNTSSQATTMNQTRVSAELTQNIEIDLNLNNNQEDLVNEEINTVSELSTQETEKLKQPTETNVLETNSKDVIYSNILETEPSMHAEPKYQDFVFENSLCMPVSDLLVPEAQQTIEIISEKQNENISMNIVHDIPSSSRQNIVSIDGKWQIVDDLPVVIPSQSPLKKPNITAFLRLPKTPIKKQKPGIEHRSFVLTSKCWEAVELQKQKKKVEETLQKEAKRKERQEKANQKRLIKEHKQTEKNKAKTADLVKRSKPKSKTPVQPKIIIHSNIQYKPANIITPLEAKIEEDIKQTVQEIYITEHKENIEVIENSAFTKGKDDNIKEIKNDPHTSGPEYTLKKHDFTIVEEGTTKEITNNADTKQEDKIKYNMKNNTEFTEKEKIKIIKSIAHKNANIIEKGVKIKEEKSASKNKNYFQLPRKKITDEELLKILTEDD